MKTIINYTKELGYEAFAEGISRYENPFEPGSIQFDDWNYGWEDAKYDRGEYLKSISPIPYDNL